MDTKTFLIQAKGLIDTPEKWAQEAYALDHEGREAGEWEDRACRFCTVGALYRTSFGVREQVQLIDTNEVLNSAYILLDRIMREKYGHRGSLIGFNDSHTHQEVMALFDAAIEAADGR